MKTYRDGVFMSTSVVGYSSDKSLVQFEMALCASNQSVLRSVEVVVLPVEGSCDERCIDGLGADYGV